MAVKELYGVTGRLLDSIDETTAILRVNATLSGAIVSSGFVNGQDETYFAIVGSGVCEVVRVVAVDGNLLTVDRHVGGTRAAFAAGTALRYEITSQAILAMLSGMTVNVAIAGTGIAQANEVGVNSFVVDVPTPDFKGENGIEVYGTYPNLRVAYTPREGNCCGPSTTSGGEGITELIGEGLVTAFVNGDVGTLRVTPPTFNAGTNISITGSWPVYTINATAGSGTVGTVGVGAGLTLTGSPSVNPVISITNTGVVAGTYGGVGINSRGQITVVPVTFNPISIITAGTNTTVNRAADAVTINVPNAAIGVRGAVALADETDPFDPNDNTTAATPAVVAVAMQSIAGATVSGTSSHSAEVPSDYSNMVGATTRAVVLAAGEQALVNVSATVINATTPLTPVEFGIAVFDATNILQGNRKITQSQQSLSFILSGPFNNTVTLATTLLPVGATLASYGMSVVKF